MVSDNDPFVRDGDRMLTEKRNPPPSELDHQGLFVNFLEKAGAERAMNGDSTGDDAVDQIAMALVTRSSSRMPKAILEFNVASDEKKLPKTSPFHVLYNSESAHFVLCPSVSSSTPSKLFDRI